MNKFTNTNTRHIRLNSLSPLVRSDKNSAPLSSLNIIQNQVSFLRQTLIHSCNKCAWTKYFKMLKIGLSLESVKHALIRDGLDPSVLDGDHNKPADYQD